MHLFTRMNLFQSQLAMERNIDWQMWPTPLACQHTFHRQWWQWNSGVLFIAWWPFLLIYFILNVVFVKMIICKSSIFVLISINKMGIRRIEYRAILSQFTDMSPDSKVNGASMGPTWGMSAPDGPHVGPMNIAVMVYIRVQYTISF